jgi:hypothetical protein
VLAAHLPLDAIRFISKTKSSWRVSGTPPEGNKKSPKQIAMKKSCLQERKPVRRIPSKSMSGEAIGPVTNSLSRHEISENQGIFVRATGTQILSANHNRAKYDLRVAGEGLSFLKARFTLRP